MLLKDLYQKIQRAKSLNGLEELRREEVSRELEDVLKMLEKLGNVQADDEHLVILQD